MAAEPRLTVLCESAKPTCPTCGGVIRRVRAHQGAFVAFCENRLPSENPERRFACGQHVYIVGTNTGICVVTAITGSEFDLLEAKPHLTPIELYRKIGLLRAAP